MKYSKERGTPSEKHGVPNHANGAEYEGAVERNRMEDAARVGRHPDDRQKEYRLLERQLASLLEGERHVVTILSGTAALLYHSLAGVSWAGFYLASGGELVLGPFQGKTACLHIASGRGVCGAAFGADKTLVVKNVHEFPGHIACDCATNSEIVIPLRAGGKPVGVLDLDSPLPGRFDERDAQGLEKIAHLVGAAGEWSRFHL